LICDPYLESIRLRNHDLTPRDIDVIEQMVTQGRSTKEAAHVLGISARSVQAIKSRIVEKLALDNWSQVVEKFAK
jgi:two-component system, LuxR family, response regulator FixJ